MLDLLVSTLARVLGIIAAIASFAVVIVVLVYACYVALKIYIFPIEVVAVWSGPALQLIPVLS